MLSLSFVNVSFLYTLLATTIMTDKERHGSLLIRVERKVVPCLEMNQTLFFREVSLDYPPMVSLSPVWPGHLFERFYICFQSFSALRWLSCDRLFKKSVVLEPQWQSSVTINPQLPLPVRHRPFHTAPSQDKAIGILIFIFYLLTDAYLERVLCQ